MTGASPTGAGAGTRAALPISLVTRPTRYRRWGRTVKGRKADNPVRVEGAWTALVSKEVFAAVQQTTRSRAPKIRRFISEESTFLPSGLLKCGVCSRSYVGQQAKGDQFAYYFCGTLHRDSDGVCESHYLNAPRVEDFIVEKIRERILTEETIVDLIILVAEDIDTLAEELAGRVEVLEEELTDVRRRLGRPYEALEAGGLTSQVLSPVPYR